MADQRRKHDSSRNGVRQPTDAEAAERISECKQLLSQGCYDGEVKKQVAAKFNLSPRSVERYLRRARNELVAETGRSKTEHRADSYGFYRHVRSNAKAPVKDRLKAQERIDKLLGLESPQELDVTSGGLPLTKVIYGTDDDDSPPGP